MAKTTAKMVIGDATENDYRDDYSGHLDDRVKLGTISDALQVGCAVSTQALVPDECLTTMRREKENLLHVKCLQIE